MESEKHLSPLDSYSLSVSSIQDMRQSLARFMEESTVSALRNHTEPPFYCPRMHSVKEPLSVSATARLIIKTRM